MIARLELFGAAFAAVSGGLLGIVLAGWALVSFINWEAAPLPPLTLFRGIIGIGVCAALTVALLEGD